jgi:hypothetical protein
MAWCCSSSAREPVWIIGAAAADAHQLVNAGTPAVPVWLAMLAAGL